MTGSQTIRLVFIALGCLLAPYPLLAIRGPPLLPEQQRFSEASTMCFRGFTNSTLAVTPACGFR